MEKKKSFSTRQITFAAIFVAIGVVVNTLRFGFFSFGGLPIIFSGYALGPGLGFVVGAVTDVVAFIVRPSPFPFNPLFILTSALTGAIPVLVTTFLKEEYPNYTFKNILIGTFIGQFLTSVFMAPIFSYFLYGRNTLPILIGKAAIKQGLSVPLYAMLIKSLLDSTTKVIDYRDL